jgi:NDP-sugar pyrophosphorylase family protein
MIVIYSERICKCKLFAAGFGKRLRPLTDYLPKVLVPILGVPAIDHVLRRLLLQGVRQVGVNAHYRSDQIRSHLEATCQKKNAHNVNTNINTSFESCKYKCKYKCYTSTNEC